MAQLNDEEQQVKDGTHVTVGRQYTVEKYE